MEDVRFIWSVLCHLSTQMKEYDAVTSKQVEIPPCVVAEGHPLPCSPGNS